MGRAGAWALVLCLAAGPAAGARVHSPRVVSPHNADAYSLRTFAEFPQWRGLTGDRLAWEVYRYLADARTGLFHMNEVLEGEDVLSEYTTVRDPVKILNVYGYGYCAIFGPTMAGIAEGIGLGPARTVVLPAWSHVAAEAFYEGSWHYLDLDLRAVFRRAGGSLASLDDARRDASLWQGPRGPLFFPEDSLESTRAIYQKTPVQHYYGFSQSGHTMDYVLRQGEAFTRWWKPQGGRWSHPAIYNREPWLRKLMGEEPRGPKPNHPSFTVHTHGNGRFVYRPDLTSRSTDFEDGAYQARNVAPSPSGLTLETEGEGFAVFEVRTPYVIVPRVGDPESRSDDREASLVRLDAAGASLAVSLDGGRSWKPVGATPVPAPAPLDLTSEVSGSYGYLLRLTLRGRPGEAVARALEVTTWVQVAPASLPSLRRGTNRMELRTGDHFGLPSRVVELRPHLGERSDLLRYCEAPPADHDPARKTSRIRGTFVLRVESPPDARIAWFSAGGGFESHQREAARNTRNSMAYAAETPADFREFYRAEVPPDNDHWNLNADREVRLQTPAKTVFVRYVGDPAVNTVRVYAHCVDDRPRPPSPVTVTHVWTEDGARKTRTVALNGPGSYQIETGKDPVDESIEISVPSGRRQ